MTWTKRVAAASSMAILTAGACVVTAAPAEAAVAKGTCSVSVKLWSNDWDEIISDATAKCNGAKAVKVRSRLYYCTWYDGDKRKYIVKKSKTIGPYGTVTGRKKATVVDKGFFGKWYAEAYVWYKKGGITYAKSAMKFGAVGSDSKNSAC
ncbi:MAG TPA: hypothetical protein VF635_00010 [Propionibacteriaceae bacterium]